MKLPLFSIVMGEIRRMPVGEEFPRYGEEYIPYHLFHKLGGVALSSSDKQEVFKSKNRTIIRYPQAGGLGPLKTVLSDKCVKKILEQIIKENELDMVNFHTFLPESMALANQKDIPVILTSHGGYPAFKNSPLWKKPLAIMRKYVERAAIKQANVLVAINKYMLNEYEKYGTGKPVKLIYSGADIEQFKPNRNKWNKPLKIVFLSRLHQQKGIWDFLKLAKELKEYEVTIIGYDEQGVAGKIDKLIENEGHVHFYPNASEEKKRQLLSESHVFISLSKGYDPTPNVLYEAMGSGMAIISTLKNYREDVLGEDAIWIESWKDVLQHLEDKRTLKAMARNLRKRAETKFNTARMAKEYKAILDSL